MGPAVVQKPARSFTVGRLTLSCWNEPDRVLRCSIARASCRERAWSSPLERCARDARISRNEKKNLPPWLPLAGLARALVSRRFSDPSHLCRSHSLFNIGYANEDHVELCEGELPASMLRNLPCRRVLVWGMSNWPDFRRHRGERLRMTPGLRAVLMEARYRRRALRESQRRLNFQIDTQRGSGQIPPEH